MFKFEIHSIVDVITNSSTVIYTCQDSSIPAAKELIDTVLKMMGEENKKADDVFYFGVFGNPENMSYNVGNISEEELPDELKMIPTGYDSLYAWIEKYIVHLMKNELETPDWMSVSEGEGDSFLYLIPKEEKYEIFGQKIMSLLNSVESVEGYN